MRVSTSRRNFEPERDNFSYNENFYLVPSLYLRLTEPDVSYLQWLVQELERHLKRLNIKSLTDMTGKGEMIVVKYREKKTKSHWHQPMDAFCFSENFLENLKLAYKGWSNKKLACLKTLYQMFLLRHQAYRGEPWHRFIQVLGFTPANIYITNLYRDRITTFPQTEPEKYVFVATEVHDHFKIYWWPVNILNDSGTVVPSLISVIKEGFSTVFRPDQKAEPVPQYLLPTFMDTFGDLSGTPLEIGAKLLAEHVVLGRKRVLKGQNSYHRTEWTYKALADIVRSSPKE